MLEMEVGVTIVRNIPDEMCTFRSCVTAGNDLIAPTPCLKCLLDTMTFLVCLTPWTTLRLDLNMANVPCKLEWSMLRSLVSVCLDLSPLLGRSLRL